MRLRFLDHSCECCKVILIVVASRIWDSYHSKVPIACIGKGYVIYVWNKCPHLCIILLWKAFLEQVLTPSAYGDPPTDGQNQKSEITKNEYPFD